MEDSFELWFKKQEHDWKARLKRIHSIEAQTGIDLKAYEFPASLTEAGNIVIAGKEYVKSYDAGVLADYESLIWGVRE